jgi:hypothetical protein
LQFIALVKPKEAMPQNHIEAKNQKKSGGNVYQTLEQKIPQINHGTIAENGVGKFDDFTDVAFTRN